MERFVGRENEDLCSGYCGIQHVMSLSTQHHCYMWESFLHYAFPNRSQKLSFPAFFATWCYVHESHKLIQGSDWLLRSILLMDLISSSYQGGGRNSKIICGLGHSVLVASCGKQVCGNHANKGFPNLITGVAVVVFSTGWLCFRIAIIFPRNLALNLVFQLFCEPLNILFWDSFLIFQPESVSVACN